MDVFTKHNVNERKEVFLVNCSYYPKCLKYVVIFFTFKLNILLYVTVSLFHEEKTIKNLTVRSCRK